MQPIHSPDTSANAMTEVALGLSMAFFSLLIVALLSMSVPIKADKVENKTKVAKKMVEKETINISAMKSNNDKKTSVASTPPQFGFYFQGKLYDENLIELSHEAIGHFERSKRLIIAVNKDIAFDEVYKLKNSIKHPQLSITTLNDEWLTRLNKMR